MTTKPNSTNVQSPLPLTLLEGTPIDTLGAGAGTIEVFCGSFEVDKRDAELRIKMTVDDSCIMTIHHEESGQDYVFEANLPPGEWIHLDDPDYWQLNTSQGMLRGHYTVNAALTNVGTAHSQNRMLLRFKITLDSGTDVVDPIPDDTPKKDIEICCSCGSCKSSDGDKYTIDEIETPGDASAEGCFFRSQYEESANQTVTLDDDEDSTTTLTGGLVFSSAWDWHAVFSESASTITINPPTGDALHFVVDAGGEFATLEDDSRKYRYMVQLERNDDNTVNALKLVDASGTQVRFDATSGQVLSIRTAAGRLTTAAQFNANVRINKNESGFLDTVYSPTEGLMRCQLQEDGANLYEWFAPEQVSLVDGNYQVTGAPFKTERILRTKQNGITTTIITRRQAGLPAQVITRTESGSVTTITKGEGAEAITRTFTENYLGNNIMETVETVSRANGQVASCTRELMIRTDGGWVVKERTEGYNSDEAQTTTYLYDARFRVSRICYPDGSYRRYKYDSLGREVLSAQPWAGGKEKMTVTTYANSRFFDNRPAQVSTIYVQGDYSQQNVSQTSYSYADSAAEERTTTTRSAAGVGYQQVEVESLFGSGATYPYAAGKIKYSQGINGVQTFHEYEACTEYGAMHKHTSITKANDELVAAQSRKIEEYIAANDTVLFEQESIWDGTEWLLLSTTAHEYDEQRREVRTTHGNGRVATKSWTCRGLLSETDEDGITVSYAYDSAHQLIETTRSAVYDGDTSITPETITEYVRDAAGRVLTTTRRIGAMETTESTAYDALGRVISRTDSLGRVTTTAYSEDGRTTTVTTPSGATLITTVNTDGSTAHQAGTGQRELYYHYDINNARERVTVRLADDSTLLSQTLTDGFGQTVVETAPTTLSNTYIYTRSTYNALGQLTQQTVDGQAPVVYAYDSMGNVCCQTVLLDATAPEDATKNRILTRSVTAVQDADGVYQVVTTARNNAEGIMLSSVQQTLISESATLESKTVSVDERGNTSTSWGEYSTGATRTQYSTIPGSALTAQTVSVDGFTTSSVDHAGITTSAARRYTASGIEYTQTDGRGNETTTRTDIAGRTISVIDAAGNTTTTAYCACCNVPAIITDPLGHTTCYRYDARGRKVAEWGTAVQPALYGYDDANRMTTLTTFRAGAETISVDPADRTDGDTTTWTYHDATGLELRKTYTDGHGSTKTYDANNRLATLTNARGTVQTNTYQALTGLLTGIEFSDDTTPQSFAYNILGQLTQVTDAAGTRTFAYNEYGEQTEDSVSVNDTDFPVVENRDALGRSTGYSLKRNAADMQVVSYGYGTDGRINTASFLHGGQQKQFGYTYLQGTHLLQTLTMPNNMTLTQSYEPQRDLLIGMAYRRSNTLVAQRTYAYDAAGRPTERNTSRNGTTRHDTFTHNSRSELTAATLGADAYAYDYDNIGNRKTAQELAEETTYTANALNQYTAIDDFTPEYDLDGNQTCIKTSTGIWLATYNALNRPVRFESADGSTVITADYDYKGRRVDKRVERNGNTTSHLRFLYRGYLQISALDLTRPTLNAMWFITWDATQPVATRPLAIQKNGTWYTYGWDLTKNICETYRTDGRIDLAYTYTPYGEVSPAHAYDQPLRWSSEYHDTELGLVYYNYRHYNPTMGRWMGRDLAKEWGGSNLYQFTSNTPLHTTDLFGLKYRKCNTKDIDSYKELEVKIELVGMLKSYTIADTNNFSFNKHIKKAFIKKLKNESQNRIDQFLRDRIHSYAAIKELVDEVEKHGKKAKGGLSFDFLMEGVSSAGHIIKNFSIEVKALFCCCKDGNYIYKRAKGLSTTQDYNLLLKAPSDDSLKKIKHLPDDLAKAALSAITSLYEHKCL